MSTILPPIPRYIFTVFEPLALFAGAVYPLFDLPTFVNSQVPSSASAVRNSLPVTPTSQILALQLCNLYGLLGLLGIGVLFWTTEKIVVRNWLVACAIGDVGHVYATYVVMGQQSFLDVQNWNATAWGNIGVTVFLFVSRCAYLMGLLGQDSNQSSGKTGKGKKTN